MVEIYKEEVIDLLSVDRNKITLKWYSDRGFQADGAKPKPCENYKAIE